MYVIASLCILFSSANIFLISSVIFVISNSPFHFYYVVAFYTFSRDFRCLGRDFRAAEFVFSTHFAYFPLFRQRFPAGGACFFYLFPAKIAVQVEIPGRRSLVSLPISPIFPVLGRDFRQAGLGFSTHFAGFPCFRQRFPDGGICFLYPFRLFSAVQVEIPGRRGLVSLPISPVFPVLGRDFRTTKLGFLYPFRLFSAVQVEISSRRKLVSLPISPVFPVLGRDSRQAGFGFSTFSRQKQLFRQRFPASPRHSCAPHHGTLHHVTPHHGAPHYDIAPHHGAPHYDITPHHGAPHHGITHRYGDTSRCSFSTHFIVIIIFYKGNN